MPQTPLSAMFQDRRQCLSVLGQRAPSFIPDNDS